MKTRLIALCSLLLLLSCGESETTLVVYTTHGKDLVEEVSNAFEAENPGVRVFYIDMGSQDALDRIRSEKVNPQADIWWGAPAPLFMQAAEENLLAPYKPSWADAVAEEFKDSKDRWYGSFLTPEVIAFNSDKLTRETAPQDWDDLLKSDWKNRVVIRNPLASGTMRAIYVGQILRFFDGSQPPTEGFDWLRKLDANTRTYTADPTLMYIQLARGETEVTLWNMPDIMLQRNQNGYPFDFVLPASGTIIVTDGMALVKGGKQPDLARKYYEFVTSKQAMIRQAEAYYRIPARQDIERDNLPEWMRAPLKTMPVDWQAFARYGADWMTYWDQNIRNQGE